MSDKKKFVLAFSLDTNLVLAPGFPKGVWSTIECTFDKDKIDKPHLEAIALHEYSEKMIKDLCSVEVFDGSSEEYLEEKCCKQNLPGTIWHDRSLIEPLLTPGLDVVVSGNGKKDFAVYEGEGRYSILRGRIKEHEIEKVQPIRTKEECLAS
ncbi:hypothetical protein ACP6H6_13505 [Vibrio harveyi]